MTPVDEELTDKGITPPLSRRQFVRLTVLGGATLLLPTAVACGDVPSDENQPMPIAPNLPRYFTDEERQALALFADYVLPPDDKPGGAALGAVTYIETLLTAFEYDPPRLFADGPFSNRNPQPLPNGMPSTVFPENSFQRFLPLTREQELAWRLELYGSTGTPGGGPNDAVLGPILGWRKMCRSGLADAAQLAGKPLEALTIDDLDGIFAKLQPDFRGFVIQRVIEAAFGAPEYGGNRDLEGWKMIHFPGDTLPMGYTYFDEAAGHYVEHPDAPYSIKGPGATLDPMDEDTHVLLRIVVAALGGRSAP